jgi:hypothetical protein
MRGFAIAAAAALAMGFGASAATATTYTVNIPGTVTSVSGSGAFQVGSTINLTAVFDDDWTVAWGATGATVAASMANFGGGANTFLPTTGAENWSISGGGIVWSARDYLFDFSQPFYHDGAGATARTFFGPFIVFDATGVLGIGNLQQVPNTNLPRPVITGSGGLLTLSGPGNFAPLSYGSTFNIGPNFAHGDIGGQSASGVWDFTKATILAPGQTGVAVPEPAAWVSLIVGFGAIGAVLRRRRMTVAA